MILTSVMKNMDVAVRDVGSATRYLVPIAGVPESLRRSKQLLVVAGKELVEPTADQLESLTRFARAGKRLRCTGPD